MAGFGFVYILYNEGMPGLLKIGYTNRAPNERARELSAPSGVPHDFEVLAYFEIEDARDYEQKIHADFAHLRPNPYREFFFVSAPELQQITNCLMAVSDTQYASARLLKRHQYACISAGLESEYVFQEAANA